jgi:MFS transporter, PPP family, 3-phenylpropionic acid transporter
VRALRIVYLALGAATACLNPFLAVILKERGLDPAVIGAITAVGACGLIGAITLWGHLGDRVFGRRATLQLCTAVAIAAAIGIAAPVPGAVLGLLVVAFVCTQGALLGLTDAVAVNNLRNPRREYGRIRLMASLSFAITAIAVGFVYDRLGYSLASALYVVTAGILIVAVLSTPEGTRATDAATPTPAPSREEKPHRLGSTGTAFAVQPRLIPVLTTVGVTWFAVTISFTFLSLRIVGLGGQASDVALSFGVSAFAEIPGMLLASRLATRIGLRGLFCASAFGYGLAFLLWAVLDSPDAIVATRLLTGFAYGGMTVAMVLTMGELLPDDLQATGQSLYQGTAIGLAAVVGNLTGGLLYGSAGPAALFVLCAAMCAAGGVLALVTLPGRIRFHRSTEPIDVVATPPSV